MTTLPLASIVTSSASIDPVDVDLFADLGAGLRRPDWHPEFPRQDDRDGLGIGTTTDGWSTRLVRRRADGLVIGTVGFFGPPEPAGDGVSETEVGYGLVEEARGRGVMGEVLPALLALTDAAGVRVRAGTTADNAASLALLRRTGFVVRSEDPSTRSQSSLLRDQPDPEREVVLVREVPG